MKTLALLFCILMCGCSLESRLAKSTLPPNAKNIVYVNHYWVTFEIEGQKYMMGDDGDGRTRVCFPVNKAQGK